MSFNDNIIFEKGSGSSAAGMAQEDPPLSDNASPRFLVNIIDRRELELLEELLTQNQVQYVVRTASRRNRRPGNNGFSILGKDIYVDGVHYDRAKTVLEDYYLGGEQATADTNTVPAARRQRVQAIRRKRYPLRRLVLWLVLATVGYSALFVLWMSVMK